MTVALRQEGGWLLYWAHGGGVGVRGEAVTLLSCLSAFSRLWFIIIIFDRASPGRLSWKFPADFLFSIIAAVIWKPDKSCGITKVCVRLVLWAKVCGVVWDMLCFQCRQLELTVRSWYVGCLGIVEELSARSSQWPAPAKDNNNRKQNDC